MSKEKTDRAERDRKETADRAEKDRVKTARKVQEKAEKAEKDRVKTARKVQEKADRTEKDRVGKARKAQDKVERVERGRLFDEVLSGASAHSKGCCEPCNFHVKTNEGEYKPCRLGHEDSGPNKEICADCSEPRYHPKK